MVLGNLPDGTSASCLDALACAVGIIAGLLATPALADKRVALVIGNSAYKNAPR